MSDFKFWDVFRDPLWLLHNFHRKYKHIRVPTNAAWTPSNVNGGVAQEPFNIVVNTSGTVSSRGLAVAYPFGLNSGNIIQGYIDWTKLLELSFILSRYNSDTEAIARIQLKSVATEGVLAAEGIGLQISNLTVVGEAYGTALQTTGTIKTLTNNRSICVKIVKTSSAVEFWIDGVLVESLTGTAVPSVAGTVYSFLVISIINGVTGGINALMRIGNIEMVQAW